MYQLSHRIYDRNGVIDDVKLFMNTNDDISDTIAQSNSLKFMVKSLDELIVKMTNHQTQQARRIRVSNENKRKMKEEVEMFGKKIANLEQKRKHLIEYLELYRVNRDKM
jgi:ACT domain-containing protein